MTHRIVLVAAWAASASVPGASTMTAAVSPSARKQRTRSSPLPSGNCQSTTTMSGRPSTAATRALVTSGASVTSV